MHSEPEPHVAAIMERITDLGTIPLGRAHPDYPVEVDAIFGAAATESSFKSILGLGLLLLARERGELSPGQTVVESTSGSLGVGVATAGKLLGHPIVLVSDVNIPVMTRRKIELLGAQLVLVDKPHATGGFQLAREERLRAMLDTNPNWYWTQQNDSELNPETYRRFLIPRLADSIAGGGYTAGIFCVGSGGHFSAFSDFLSSLDVPSYVADREGSVTFGGHAAPSRIRGSGNQHGVPKVAEKAMEHVKKVFVTSDAEAFTAIRDLAARGVHVGPSSGVCWHGARLLACSLGTGRILTFFPDRSEVYGPDILEM